MELEKVLLRKVGVAVARFKMIRDGDRVAVALPTACTSLITFFAGFIGHCA